MASHGIQWVSMEYHAIPENPWNPKQFHETPRNWPELAASESLSKTFKKLHFRKTNLLKPVENDIKVIYHRGGAFFHFLDILIANHSFLRGVFFLIIANHRGGCQKRCR